MNTEPGLPGDLDDDGKPYFFPSNQERPADSREQRDGFIPRWEYRGHTDSIKDVCAAGEDSFGRMRFVSTDGKNAASWLELSDGDSVRIATCEHVINAMTYVPPLNVVAAASVSVGTNTHEVYYSQYRRGYRLKVTLFYDCYSLNEIHKYWNKLGNCLWV